MSTILFFEDTYSVKGVYPAKVVLASEVPISFIPWGFYPTAQGHGWYAIFTNTDGDYDYVAVDYSADRAGRNGTCDFAYDAWQLRRTAAPYLRLYNTVMNGRK